MVSSFKKRGLPSLVKQPFSTLSIGVEGKGKRSGEKLSLFVGSKAQGLGPCLVGVREFKSRPPHAGVAKSGQTTFFASERLDQKGRAIGAGLKILLRRYSGVQIPSPALPESLKFWIRLRLVYPTGCSISIYYIVKQSISYRIEVVVFCPGGSVVKRHTVKGSTTLRGELGTADKEVEIAGSIPARGFS